VSTQAFIIAAWPEYRNREVGGIMVATDNAAIIKPLGHDLTQDEVRVAVSSANVPTLLMLVFQMTGDERWLEDPYRPTRGRGLGDHDTGGLAEEQQDEIRAAAVQAILDLQSGKKPAIPIPPPELISRMMTVCMGEPVASKYGEMLFDEIAKRIDPEAPGLALPPVKSSRDFKVVVVGAGLAGIAAAHQLEDMGVDYVVIEKKPAAGGNWLENNYPGCGVDTPSHLYSYSFARNDWRKHFELRAEIQSYFDDVLVRLGASKRVRYQTEVIDATYDEVGMIWRVTITDIDGNVETIHAKALISAVGVLNRPKVPAVAGMGTFAGPEFHSSHWPPELDITGKRVAIVGSGASAMQIVPAIAGQVKHLVVFQRSKHWAAPFEKFQQPISPELRQLLQTCPIYFAWYWARLFWQFGDKVIEALRIDPDWPHPERSVNARNDGHRAYFTRYIETILGDRPDLIEKTVPDYPPYGKRILLDNGWYHAIIRDNVELVLDGIKEVRPHSVVSQSGEEYGDFDVLIWATGFEAAKFLAALNVTGRDGVTIRDEWDDTNPRAYMGVAVPGFPNFFMLGGPNTFPGAGSFTYFNETQMKYIRQLLTHMINDGIDEVEVRREVYEEYNDRVDETHARTVWSHPGMSTYFRNDRGRVVFLNPFLNIEFWEMTKTANLDEYHLKCRRPADMMVEKGGGQMIAAG
jgi:4-hydroxyacetophenone monooxygenase